MNRSLRFGLVLSPAEKHALIQLAETDGGLSRAAVLRRLIRTEAQRRGLWPPDQHDAQARQQAEEDQQ